MTVADSKHMPQRLIIVIVCTCLVFVFAIALFVISFVSNGIVWFVLAICLAALELVIMITGIYTYYHMGIEKIRVHRIDRTIDIAFWEEDTKAALSRSYVCCGKYNLHEFNRTKPNITNEFYQDLPPYCCPKRYEYCNVTVVFRKGCFEAMLDFAPFDDLAFFLKNFVVYFILVGLSIAVAVAEASYLRYRRY